MKVKVTELGAEKALIVGRRYEEGAEVLVPDILGRLLVERGAAEEVKRRVSKPDLQKAVKEDSEKAVK